MKRAAILKYLGHAHMLATSLTGIITAEARVENKPPRDYLRITRRFSGMHCVETAWAAPPRRLTFDRPVCGNFQICARGS